MSKLFIYIPTYNRPEALRTQLSALVPQIVDLPEKVRLLVSDNDSGGELFLELARKYAPHRNIEFRRNAGNIGGNANIALGFVFAQKDEFLWLLSDNDIISDTAVHYILGVLDERVDFYCFNDSVKEPTEVAYSWKSGWQTPMDWRMGLISDALYNMSTVKDSIDAAFYYHNSSFPHLAVACAAARSKGSVKFKLLPRERINNNLFRSDESPTDYSLAHVCMPLLVPLFPPAEAKSFALGWIRRHVVDMYRNRKFHYHLYLLSKATLTYYGGWFARLMLYTGWPAYLFDYLFRPIRRKCVEIAKQRLSPTAQEKLKKLREILCGK